MLINLTNHPSTKWDDKQLNEAKMLYSEIMDIQFPNVSPEFTQEDIDRLGDEYLDKILSIDSKTLKIVHIMGEMSLTFNLINKLKQHDIPCVASTTQRDVEELSDGSKVVRFNFVQFRPYF